ncbi:hypothetical protein H8E07_20075 [bacterium]|nr:hypothetical protein [bacterium]
MSPAVRSVDDKRRARSHAQAVRAGGEPFASSALSPADDHFLETLASRLKRAGLATSAILWLASIRPLSFLGSQALHVAAPLLDVLVSGEGATRLARILEDRANLDRFLSHLETDDTREGAQS